MKKIYIFLLLMYIIPYPLLAISGLGTFARPYSGSITADTTWNTSSNKIYINGDITMTAHLTINSGLIIVFVTAGADLIITGNGILSASGGSGANMIRFTADYDNNSNYGESGERWGHISFQNMTTTNPSIIDNCIIEFGQKSSSPWNFESSGGGIHTAYSYLTISNSIIRNNYAGWGGGIYVNANASPSISSCLISNNTAGTTGGGMSIYQNSASVVSNCIIEKNTCNGGGSGGGIFIGDYPDNVRLYNCTIASNSSTSGAINIRIWKSVPSTGPQIFNTIVWGSNNSINYYELGPSITDFNYCAIQGYTSGYTSCINLSGTNGDPTGPNFYNITAGSEDYRINFISPCRDAGTSTGAPSTDYLGNTRIYNYDIGAYEVQYSRWTGATDGVWSTNTNWEQNVGPATGNADVIIPYGLTRYPTADPIKTFIIGTGRTMILNPGARTTLSTFTNNGTLKLESDATGIASLLIDTYGGSGTNEIQLYLEGNSNGTMWHYISPPVASLSTDVFNAAGIRAVAAYEENLITNDMNNGWVTYLGWHYITDPPENGQWVDQSTTLSWPVQALVAGSGYNYYASTNRTFSIPGTINTGDVNKSLAYNSGGFTPNPVQHGWNLIGNPFTCGLDWDGVISANSGIWTDVESTIYFRVNGVTIYYGGGFTVPDTYNTDGSLVPPMQGFFIKSNLNNVSLSLPASAKAHTANKRYKGSSTPPHIRLQFENAVNSDQTIVSFDEKATLSFDNLFDGRKVFTSESDPYLYSILNGTHYAINGIPFPENSITIPLVVNANSSGSYTIKATELTGLENYRVLLEDKTQNITVNLSNVNSYSFNAPTGKFTDRFTLTITNVLTGIPESTITNKPFNIYSSQEQINVQTLSDDWNGKRGEIKVLDLSGRTISEVRNIEFEKGEVKQIPSNGANGLYLIQINSGGKRYVGKVVVR